ncbi:porin [Roseibium sp. TrichSKD4]|uniref:porin n=1 Tax=Roseibium sp. TrichSKD4 TaxID=744980 RepID=UPI0002E0FCBB|nr:porin [Roseibium sp. TrichSKD4]
MNFKGLMLAAAAATAATGASAADLPVAPEPVDYVKVCDAYGARFFYIPGTDTCLRVGGRVRAQVNSGNFADRDDANRDGFSAHADDGIDMNAEGYLYLDSRTSTEFGLLRTYTEIEVESDNDVSLGKAFIQWGGVTAGHATSFFDFFTGQVFVGSVGRNWSDATTNLFAYTAAFGNGFSATISLEDGRVRESGDYGGTRYPDLVANLRVDQGWGSAQLSGAVHHVNPADVTAKGDTGWAVGGGVIINLPMLSSASNIAFQAQYADGALSYIGAPNSTADYDATGGTTKTNKGYALSAGIYHEIGNIGLALDGSYADVDVANNGNDVSRWAVDGSVQWEPVSGLQLGVDMGYANTDIDNTTGDLDEWKAGFRMQRTF